MCNPAVILATTLVSAGVQAYSSIQQGKGQAAMAEYQARINENNAVLAEFNAAQARKQGDIEAKQIALRTKQLIGQQKTAFAANGVEVGFGSPIETLVGTEVVGTEDMLFARYNADLKALGFEQQAQNLNAEATLNRMAGSAAKSAGYADAFGSVLTGASTFGKQWTTFYPKTKTSEA